MSLRPTKRGKSADGVVREGHEDQKEKEKEKEKEKKRVFWYFDAAAAAKTVQLPVTHFDDLRQYSTSFEEGSLPDGFFQRQTPMSFIAEFLCCVQLLLFPGCLLWIWIPVFYLIYALITISSHTWVAFVVPLLVIGVVLLFTRMWFVTFRSTFVPLLYQYFSMKIVWEDGYSPELKSMLLAPPHGVFPFGNLLTLLLWSDYTTNPFLGIAANVLFYFPIIRQLFNWIGIIPAEKHVIVDALAQGHGIGVAPGGIAELFEAGNEKETLVLKKRKGIVKIGLRTGTQMVPCYLFGNTQCLHMLNDHSGRMTSLSRRMRASVTFFWGRFFLPIAFRTPILGACGRPINVPHPIPIPSNEEINQYHARVVQGVEDLYHLHQSSYGWREKGLVIK